MVEVPDVCTLGLVMTWPPRWEIATRPSDLNPDDNPEAAWEAERKALDVLGKACQVTDQWADENPGGFGPAYGEPGYQLADLVAKAVGGKAHLPPIPPPQPGVVY